jgi:beta-lactamase regulating signal transducer with metallopeptidase domain/peroxiredoxin
MTAFFAWFAISSLWQPALLLSFGIWLKPYVRKMNAASQFRFWATLLLLSSLLPTLSAFRSIRSSALVGSTGQAHGDATAWMRLSESGAITIPLRGVATASSQWLSALAHAFLAIYLLIFGIAIWKLGWAFWQTLSVMAESRNEPIHPEIADVVSIYCDRLGISEPRILYSTTIKCAATINLWRPILFLPSNLMEFSTSEIRTALAHELAHIKRHDFASNLIIEILSLPLAFHPATRRMKDQLAASRECACDEIGQALIESRTEYARSLLQIVSRAAIGKGQRDFCLSLTGTPAVLEMRFASLLEGPAPERERTISSTVTCAALCVVSVILSVLHVDTRRATFRSGSELGTGSSQVIEVSRRESAPNFSLTDLNGNVVQLSDYRGKYVVLNFWATWCRPCAIESRNLDEIEGDYTGRGVEVIGISMDSDQMDSTPRFVKSHGLKYEILLGSDSVLKRYSLTSVPSTFLIDQEGRIAMTHSAAIDPKQLRRQLDELLKGS